MSLVGSLRADGRPPAQGRGHRRGDRRGRDPWPQGDPGPASRHGGDAAPTIGPGPLKAAAEKLQTNRKRERAEAEKLSNEVLAVKQTVKKPIPTQPTAVVLSKK